MKSFKGIISKSLLASAICVFFLQAPASAFDGAILKGIKVDMAGSQGYKITVKTDKDVPIKKYTTAANKVVLDLKNIRPAQFVNTVYSNAPEIDHVIVQPTSGDKLRIFIQGMNIASSKIILDTRDEALDFLQAPVYPQEENISAEELLFNKDKPVTERFVQEQPVESVFIDLSNKKASRANSSNSIDKIKSVTPVISLKQQSGSNFNSVKESVVGGSSMNKIFEASTFDWALRFLMLGLVIVGGFKFFKKPKNVEINLSSEEMKHKELSLYKSVDSKKELLTRSLGLPAPKQSVAKKPNYSSISRYGINEYKNSQLPPGKTALPVSGHSLNIGARPKPAPQTPAMKPKTAQAPVRPGPAANATKITPKQTAQAKENFDGIKFLETMAGIYQKSGRTDLASGIRQSIIQKQQSA